MSEPPLHVTFICRGNVCRSPMAEKMFAHQIRQRGLTAAVRVTSAGTHGSQHIGGDGGWALPAGADRRACRVLGDHGYPTAHRAAQVGDDHLAADLVVALDRDNARYLARMGAPADRLRLLRSFDPGGGGQELDVDNPYNGSQAHFDAVFTVIAAALPGLHDWVDKQLAERDVARTDKGVACE